MYVIYFVTIHFICYKKYEDVIKLINIILYYSYHNQLGKLANLGTIPKLRYHTQVRPPKVPKFGYLSFTSQLLTGAHISCI